MNLKVLIFLVSALAGLGVHATESLDLTASKVQTLKGLPTTLKTEMKGPVLLLDFWASWCEPCKESLPYYEALEKRYGSKGLQVIAVSVDDTLKAANEFTEKNKLKLQTLWAPNKDLINILDIKAIPTLIILDRTGKILHRERGYRPDTKEKLEKLIPKLL